MDMMLVTVKLNRGFGSQMPGGQFAHGVAFREKLRYATLSAPGLSI
jgi:hypothetical protein